MENIEEQILSSLTLASGCLGQALKKLHPSLRLYRDIKRVQESLTQVCEDLRDGDYIK